MYECWKLIKVGKVEFWAAINYRGNIVVCDSPGGTDKEILELVPDLEYREVIVV